MSVLRAIAASAEESQAADAAARAQLRILDVDPWNEAAHLGLIRVKEQAGRHGEARRYFESYCRRMVRSV